MKRLIHSKWLLPSLFIALVLNGIEFELLGLLSDVPTYQAASALILATSLFGLYLIPFSVGICYLAKRYQMSGFLYRCCLPRGNLYLRISSLIW